MRFEEIVSSTESIAKENPGLLGAWLFVLLAKGDKVAASVADVTQPSDDRLLLLADCLSSVGIEILAEFREMCRLLKPGHPVALTKEVKSS